MEVFSLPGINRRSDLDDEAGENVVGIMNMRVLLDDERIAALVTDSMQRLGFADDVYLVAGTVHELLPVHPLKLRAWVCPQRAQQDACNQSQGQAPRCRVRDCYDRRCRFS